VFCIKKVEVRKKRRRESEQCDCIKNHLIQSRDCLVFMKPFELSKSIKKTIYVDNEDDDDKNHIKKYVRKQEGI
jgi:hypothetical protein